MGNNIATLPQQSKRGSTDERYSPPWLLNRVTAFYGTPEWLDPCPASYGHAPLVNGLAIPWRGNTYVNGPYSNLDPWVVKFLTEPITQGLFLCPANTGAQWFQRLFDCPILFLRQRIRFIGPDGKEMGSPPFDSALVYRGSNPSRFADMWGDLGRITIAAPLGRTWRERTQPERASA